MITKGKVITNGEKFNSQQKLDMRARPARDLEFQFIQVTVNVVLYLSNCSNFVKFHFFCRRFKHSVEIFLAYNKRKNRKWREMKLFI